MSAQTSWLTLSSLEHYAYCSRQAALLRDGVWADNHLTVAGSLGHARVDSDVTDHRRGVRIHHRVDLANHDLMVRGIADTVEERPDGSLCPVEHKRGRGAGDLWPATVQVVAQALCLEEMTGSLVATAALFIMTPRQRIDVDVSAHRKEVQSLILEAHAALEGGTAPTAIYDRRRCTSCSIQNACQPRGGQWA